MTDTGAVKRRMTVEGIQANVLMTQTPLFCHVLKPSETQHFLSIWCEEVPGIQTALLAVT